MGPANSSVCANPVPLLLRDARTDLATLQVLGVAVGFAVGVLSPGVRVRGSAALGVLIHPAGLERLFALPWLSVRLRCRCHLTALPRTSTDKRPSPSAITCGCAPPVRWRGVPGRLARRIAAVLNTRPGLAHVKLLGFATLTDPGPEGQAETGLPEIHSLRRLAGGDVRPKPDGSMTEATKAAASAAGRPGRRRPGGRCRPPLREPLGCDRASPAAQRRLCRKQFGEARPGPTSPNLIIPEANRSRNLLTRSVSV
jgi:hypothetical protein